MDSAVRILEVGGGVGATVERIVEALEPRSVEALYITFVDIEAANVETARASLRTWAQDRGYNVSGKQPQVWTGPLDVSLQFQTADLFDVASAHDGPAYDALVAQAVFDLLPIADTLRVLSPLVRPGGLWYLPIHFDGVTAFEPLLDADLDAKVERLFHDSMTSGEEEGDGRSGPHCGRRLLSQLHTADTALVDAGASDWVVLPQSDPDEEDAYPGEEAYFLHHILHFVETELTGHPKLDPASFSDWVAARRRQVEAGELIYIAHQLDVLARSA